MKFLMKLRKIVTFINDFLHVRVSRAREYFKAFVAEGKLGTAFRYAFDTCVTGWMIHYAITNSNFLSWGFVAALSTYYGQRIIQNIIKVKKA
jgi:hypothetical protein